MLVDTVSESSPVQPAGAAPSSWQFTSPAPKQPRSTTIIMKLANHVNITTLRFTSLCAAILDGARLTKFEQEDTYIRLRAPQNLLAIDTFRPTAHQKLLQLTNVTIDGESLETNSYVANDPLNARGVIHGITNEITDEYLSQHVRVENAKLLEIRRLGRTNTILLTVEGPRLPRYAFIRCGAYPIYPQRARSKQCTLCHGTGHRADVCPNKTSFTRCPICSKVFPYNHDPLNTPHDCDPHCFNCNGEHPPSSSACPARAKADEDAQKWQRIHKRHRFRAVAPPSQDLQSWPALPTTNRFDILQAPRSRSRSQSRPPHDTRTPSDTARNRDRTPKPDKQKDSNTPKADRTSRPSKTSTPTPTPLAPQGSHPTSAPLPPQTRRPTFHPTYSQTLLTPTPSPPSHCDIIQMIQQALAPIMQAVQRLADRIDKLEQYLTTLEEHPRKRAAYHQTNATEETPEAQNA
ncbi:hypothetical protein HPB47_002166 [Ixodes persulcatus]|uniref:Uncharacterized protein n=1 Tax=Ixodes persulcatus TaxID=34615 RepID=A0AC60PMA5_IXOPE|nr:hypothetical protein HPB47_002166 [Ixodes persulcatus]